MTDNPELAPAILAGWHDFQALVIRALGPLTEAQLALRAAPSLRTVDEIARHMIGARARWFASLMSDGGEAIKPFGRWDQRGAPARSAAELVSGLEQTWAGMQAAITGWSLADWARTWPGEDETEPAVITPHWIVWHLIEHDLHHGGEISLTLGAHGLEGLGL